MFVNGVFISFRICPHLNYLEILQTIFWLQDDKSRQAQDWRSIDTTDFSKKGQKYFCV